MEGTIAKESFTELTRKGTCVEFFSAYQEHDYVRMLTLFAPDATIEFSPLGDGGKGTVADLGKTLWMALMDCFPDIDNTIDTFENEGNTIVCKVNIFGTQAKDFAGIVSKGLRFESDHIFIFQFDDDDNITSLVINWDHQSFCKQLS